MIVTVVCDVLGKENNGTTIAAMNLIRSLKAKGYEVRVVCPDKEYAGKESFYVVPTLNLGPINGYIEKNGVSLAKVDKKIMFDAINGADVVHVMLPFSLGRAAVKICGQLNIPVTAGFHAQAENVSAHLKMRNFEPVNRIYYKSRWKKVYQYVDCIHYPTEFIRNVFEQNIRSATEGRVISNGVNKAFIADKPIMHERNGKFKIICTGRYSAEKRQSILIDAVALSKHKDDINVVFAGAGPLKEKLISRSEKKGINASFKFFGRDELIEELHTADLYVHTAEIEIEAIACLEAIASGLVPVIANSPKSATKGYALCDDNLFDYDSAASLAEKIDFWYEHPERVDGCLSMYSDFTKEIDYDVCMDKMENMLLDVVERHTGRSLKKKSIA